MSVIDTLGEGTPKGWRQLLFGRATPPRRMTASAGPSIPEVSATLLAAEFAEERMRAATSGFEMGEYEPLLRRN